MKSEFLPPQFSRELWDERNKDLDNEFKKLEERFPAEQNNDKNLKTGLKQPRINLSTAPKNQLKLKSKTLRPSLETKDQGEAVRSKMKQLEIEILESDFKIVRARIELNEELIKTTKKEIQTLENKIDNVGEKNDLFFFISLLLGVFIIAGMRLTTKTKSNGF
ncbi:MAG: hypothetical protein RIS20_1867 [Bacteroidota bacterium]|jgi:DNA mismatch repair ATPase MutS